MRVAVAVSLTIFGSSAAHTQTWASVDIGGATVRYEDSTRVTATTFSPRIRLDEGPLGGGAAGTLASLIDGGWTAQGAFDLSVLSGALGPLRLEIAGEAGGSLHDDATRTGQYIGRARLHVGDERRGLWAGAANGKTWDASLWHRVAQTDFGAWVRVGRAQIVATVTPWSIGDSLRYTDTQGGARWDGSRLELAGGIGARAGDAIARVSPSVWGSASATLWMSRNVGIVASGGTYPVDYREGYPGGRYVSLALRLGARPMIASLRPSTDPSGLVRRAEKGRPPLQITAAPNGQRVIRVRAPGARSVEVMGDFTAWQALSLTPAPAGWWTATLAIPPGTYQLNVRVDGSAWDAPADVLEITDEFGARVGVIDVR